MDKYIDEENYRYNIGKWLKIIDMRERNYMNILNRLKKNQKISNFVLIYYSIFLIINTLTAKYFSRFYDIVLAEYFGLIMSIIVLAYSIINNSENYETRIVKMEQSLNDLKKIKRNIERVDLSETIYKYNEITDTTEKRTDTDSFITLKHLCKKYGINWFTKKIKNTKSFLLPEEIEHQKEINDYVSEINVFAEQGKIIILNIWYIILILIPAVIFLVCCFSKNIDKIIDFL